MRCVVLLMAWMALSLVASAPAALAQGDEFSNNTRGGVQDACQTKDERDGWECTRDPNPHSGPPGPRWCHLNPPSGPPTVFCLPAGEQPPYLKIGGAPPEGPYLGNIPPTGQIPRRGPAAYPPGRVTAQAPSQGSSPYAYPAQSPYGDGGVTAQPAPTTQPPPAGRKYPVVLGMPTWLPPKGLDVRAYRFDDGHVYEFETQIANDVLLTDNEMPPVGQRQGNRIQLRATYRDFTNGVVSLRPGTWVNQ